MNTNNTKYIFRLIFNGLMAIVFVIFGIFLKENILLMIMSFIFALCFVGGIAFKLIKNTNNPN